MARTVIDVDEAQLAAAARALGTRTKVATVNLALAHIAARDHRIAFLDLLDVHAADLDDDGVMSTAWR